MHILLYPILSPPQPSTPLLYYYSTYLARKRSRYTNTQDERSPTHTAALHQVCVCACVCVCVCVERCAFYFIIFLSLHQVNIRKCTFTLNRCNYFVFCTNILLWMRASCGNLKCRKISPVELRMDCVYYLYCK